MNATDWNEDGQGSTVKELLDRVSKFQYGGTAFGHLVAIGAIRGMEWRTNLSLVRDGLSHCDLQRIASLIF